MVPGAGALTATPHDATAQAAWAEADGGPATPQALNRYSYVLNNPVNDTDSTGHCSEYGIGSAVCGGGGGGGTGGAGGGKPATTPAKPATTPAQSSGKAPAPSSGSGTSGASTSKGAQVAESYGIDPLASPATRPYQRPSGSVTPQQRAAVQGQPCVECGKVSKPMIADHKDPLVVEHYRTGDIDTVKMRSVNSVQPQCQTCSNRQGGQLSAFSRYVKALLFGGK